MIQCNYNLIMYSVITTLLLITLTIKIATTILTYKWHSSQSDSYLIIIPLTYSTNVYDTLQLATLHRLTYFIISFYTQSQTLIKRTTKCLFPQFCEQVNAILILLHLLFMYYRVLMYIFFHAHPALSKIAFVGIVCIMLIFNYFLKKDEYHSLTTGIFLKRQK